MHYSLLQKCCDKTPFLLVRLLNSLCIYLRFATSKLPWHCSVQSDAVSWDKLLNWCSVARDVFVSLSCTSDDTVHFAKATRIHNLLHKWNFCDTSRATVVRIIIHKMKKYKRFLKIKCSLCLFDLVLCALYTNLSQPARIDESQINSLRLLLFQLKSTLCLLLSSAYIYIFIPIPSYTLPLLNFQCCSANLTLSPLILLLHFLKIWSLAFLYLILSSLFLSALPCSS